MSSSLKKLELNDIPNLSTCTIEFIHDGKSVKIVPVSANLTKMLITFLKDTEMYSSADYHKDLAELNLKLVPLSPPTKVYIKQQD